VSAAVALAVVKLGGTNDEFAGIVEDEPAGSEPGQPRERHSAKALMPTEACASAHASHAASSLPSHATAQAARACGTSKFAAVVAQAADTLGVHARESAETSSSVSRSPLPIVCGVTAVLFA
jgi:hypothetical protein